MMTSAGIILALGVVHLIYTFCGNKLTPRDTALANAMREVSPVISRQTTMWKAWVSFNASHSLGAMLFGLIYGYLAVVHPVLLFQSHFLLAVGGLLPCAYFVLGWRYWFSVPFRGVCIALTCYIAAIIAAYT